MNGSCLTLSLSATSFMLVECHSDANRGAAGNEQAKYFVTLPYHRATSVFYGLLGKVGLGQISSENAALVHMPP